MGHGQVRQAMTLKLTAGNYSLSGGRKRMLKI